MNKLQEIKEMAKNVRLLYVEDNEVLRESFFAYLGRFFSDIVVCKDGLEGLEAYQNNQFDLVITDINMPNMDGLEMSKKIKAMNSCQHILIISAYQDIQNYIDSIKIGIDGYLLKPIEYEQFNFTLAKVLHLIQTARENDAYKNHLEEMVLQKTAESYQHLITDSMTGLHNRVYLDEEINPNKRQILLLLNIDDFSRINSNFGFALGDELIVKVAARLSSFIYDDFELYRLSGDQFVFLSHNASQDEAIALAEKIQQHFDDEVVSFDGMNMRVSFTFAIDSGKGKDLLRNTSLTIDSLRQYSKHTIGVYQKNSAYESEQRNNIFWVEKIKKLLLDDALVIHFQPIVESASLKPIKYEVLCRINDDNGDMIMPGQFLKPLSLSGFMPRLTQEIIDKAFAYIQATEVSISLNVTDEDLNCVTFVDYLEAKRQQYGLSAEQITLEILESISSNDHSESFNRLHQLKALGYELAIDDFGIENSNFSRLLRLQTDFIKIDGSFIKELATDSNSQQIVSSIVSFAHNIGAQVIAEFVHNDLVTKACKTYGIDYLQGFYTGKPAATIEEIELRQIKKVRYAD